MVAFLAFQHFHIPFTQERPRLQFGIHSVNSRNLHNGSFCQEPRATSGFLGTAPPHSRLTRFDFMPRPVIVWLTKTSADAAIWTAALSSGRRIVPVHCESVLEVVHAAQLSFANVVYASASRILRSDILFLESRGVSPVIVNPHHAEMPSKKYSTFHSSCMATLSVATTPLLLETKGDAVTRFFEGNDDGISDRKLVVEEVVDNRTVKERIIAWLTRVYLPTGFPDTTTPDYLSFTKYRTIQNLASAIMSVISTEALLFGLGLGKKVAAGAAATSWVLKDGASYLVKIFYGSVFGDKFDDDPKSWRIAADIVEDVGGAIEILTPLFPMTYFLPLASLAVCLRGTSLMTGTATRHVVYRSLAANGMQNTGDIATKGESQGVTMKMLGLGTGILVSSRIGQNYYALLAAYGALAAIHIAANWKSVQCVQFSFFNKQRASILIENHLKGQRIPSPYEVSSMEKVVLPPWRGFEPKVKIGVGVQESVQSPEVLNDTIKLFRGERFLIFSETKSAKIRVLLRDSATPKDVLRAYYTVKKYMKTSTRSKEELRESLRFMKRNIKSFENASSSAGWDIRHMLLTDGSTRVRW